MIVRYWWLLALESSSRLDADAIMIQSTILSIMLQLWSPPGCYIWVMVANINTSLSYCHKRDQEQGVSHRKGKSTPNKEMHRTTHIALLFFFTYSLPLTLHNRLFKSEKY
ncbi:unnamed protein product [Citrullus colocynthis]|uniref:Uncharacterized protein n=1 Tax=Citrullus colocynthis TaxID=252529 RepID=A0ABP0YTB4_9ROSI